MSRVTDERFMQRALELGRRGLGRTLPNPSVGAVLVRSGRIVGEGFHRRAGGPHAEIEAIRAAGRRAEGAVLYVTLEPCVHTGRTGPCVEALRPLGLRRIVVSVPDPNPRVRGRGIRRLRDQGVRVDVGVCATAGRELTAGYRSRILRGRPRTTAKVAASLDARVALVGGASRWITSAAARRVGHRMRAAADAVLVGAGTVRVDDPRLTCRIRGGHDPIRIVVAGRDVRVPIAARVFDDRAPSWIVVPSGADARRLRRLERRGVEVLEVRTRRRRPPIDRVLDTIAARGVGELLIEGGSTLLTDALTAGVVDRLAWFVAPRLIGGDGVAAVGPLGIRTMPETRGLRLERVEPIGPDLLCLLTLRTRARRSLPPRRPRGK